MSYLCPHYDSFPSGGARSAEKKYDRKQPNRLFSGANRRKCYQAKVFKAHAVTPGS